MLCCVIVFGSVSKPVNAIAGLDDAVYFALAAVVMSLACDIAVDNPATGAELLKLWDALSDGAQQAVQAAADGIVLYGNTVYNWEVETWTNLANEVKSWMDDNHAPVSSIGQVNVTNADGYIGFTDDTYFTMYFPAGYTQVVYSLPSSVFFAWNHVDPAVIPSYYSTDFQNDFQYAADDHEPVNAYMLKSANGLSVYAWAYDRWGEDFDNGYIRPSKDWYSYGYGYRFITPCLSPSSFNFPSARYYNTINGHSCTLKSVTGGYAFVDKVDGTYFDNRVFSSEFVAQDWFLHSCGLYTYSTTSDTAQVYVDQSATDDVIDYDPDRTQTVIDNINDHVIDDQLPMVIPGSDDLLKDIADSPDLVWDVSAAGVYTGSIDLPTVPGNIWYDKFPFCVPYDVVRLFTSFAAEPEAPSFHILVLPENSFGFENEAVYFDIDFADYDILVKILRFFLAAGFVLWLIVMTRKLIRG